MLHAGAGHFIAPGLLQETTMGKASSMIAVASLALCAAQAVHAQTAPVQAASSPTRAQVRAEAAAANRAGAIDSGQADTRPGMGGGAPNRAAAARAQTQAQTQANAKAARPPAKAPKAASAPAGAKP
jgi:hypothetical protein